MAVTDRGFGTTTCDTCDVPRGMVAAGVGEHKKKKKESARVNFDPERVGGGR